MCRLVVIQHEVDGVSRGSNEDNLEEGVPKALSRVGPEKIYMFGCFSMLMTAYSKSCSWYQPKYLVT